MAKQRDSASKKKTARGSVKRPRTIPAATTLPSDRQGVLFDKGAPVPRGVEIKPIRYPIWTESKAHLIQNYLRLFTFITHHGTYIDAFAGPQQTDRHDMWSAKLVLETTPRLLRKFYLFEQDKRKVETLRSLAEEHQAMLSGVKEKREIVVTAGDCNVEIPKFLEKHPLKDSEAAFALLDQRTFECQWDTVRTLATHKKGGNKIELFYFLPNHWLARSIAGLTKNVTTAERWWREDWRIFAKLKPQARADLVTNRIRDEFGYADVKAWPISERRGGGNIMYFMIHATDHPEAPKLMRRAYTKAVDPTQPVDQLTIDRLLAQPD